MQDYRVQTHNNVRDCFRTVEVRGLELGSQELQESPEQTFELITNQLKQEVVVFHIQVKQNLQ